MQSICIQDCPASSKTFVGTHFYLCLPFVQTTSLPLGHKHHLPVIPLLLHLLEVVQLLPVLLLPPPWLQREGHSLLASQLPLHRRTPPLAIEIPKRIKRSESQGVWITQSMESKSSRGSMSPPQVPSNKEAMEGP